MTKLETNRKCHLPTWQLAGHVVPSFEKFLASFLCLKAVTQHDFLEIFGKFAEELREIIERNLRALRAKLLPKATEGGAGRTLEGGRDATSRTWAGGGAQCVVRRVASAWARSGGPVQVATGVCPRAARECEREWGCECEGGYSRGGASTLAWERLGAARPAARAR